MAAEPSIFQEDDQADARRHAEALADLEAGRTVPHEEVRAWLETWGKPDEKPAPKSWSR